MTFEQFKIHCDMKGIKAFKLRLQTIDSDRYFSGYLRKKFGYEIIRLPDLELLYNTTFDGADINSMVGDRYAPSRDYYCHFSNSKKHTTITFYLADIREEIKDVQAKLEFLNECQSDECC